MKKIIFILLSLLLCFSFVACSKDNVQDNAGNTDSGNKQEQEQEQEQTYIISFDTDGGNVIGSITVKFNDRVTLPTPEKDRYIFTHWVIKGTNTVVSSGAWTIERNVELLAIWEIDYTFTY